MEEIALCLSGGGYRAAMYHLGVISFLNEIRTPDGTPLLDHIHTITCISGGALPGLKYILGEIDEIDRTETVKSLYRDLVENNLGEQLLKKYGIESLKGKSLIRVLSDVYDETFFKGRKFGEILEFMEWDKIHHFAVDSTDFATGKPFRFQATAKIEKEGRREPYGVIGNRINRIHRDTAMNIRIADIMACTSCFPLVFEPMAYPEDFTFDTQISDDQFKTYTLMDGGLVDNQGIDPAIHANKHLDSIKKSMDIIIISDAGIAGIQNDSFIKSSFIFSEWTPRRLQVVLSIFATLSLIISFLANSYPFIAGISFTLSLLLTALNYLLSSVSKKIFSVAEKELKFKISDNDFFWKNKLGNIWDFVRTRLGTAYRMVDFVMMGHIKRKTLNSLYTDGDWQNKVIIDTLSAFAQDDIWKRVLKKDWLYNNSYKPGKRMRTVSLKASSMGTTLWFTRDEIEKEIPKAIFACGQYTTCWNLILFAERIQNKVNTDSNFTVSEGQNLILNLLPVLKGSWNRFQNNPYCLTSKFTNEHE